MRHSALAAALLLAISAPVAAQAPPTLQPVPDAPPQLSPLDPSLEPQVTIRKKDGDTIEEYRVNGILTRIVVTPEYGAPYTLVDQSGQGLPSPFGDGPGTPQLSVPMWTILKF
jgi:hypothetical protein